MIRLLEEAFKRLKVERLRRERMKNSKPSVSQFAKYVCKVLGSESLILMGARHRR